MAISESEKTPKPTKDTQEGFVHPTSSLLSSNKSNASNMEYAWMEPVHDPIATDTNLAEIDFEDFKNEDLAYAFSCGDDESGGSSTDMSICRSEALFSSMRDSANGGNVPSNMLNLPAGLNNQRSLIQDSLIDGAEDLDFSEQVKVNKNHYTLTYSSHAHVPDGAGSIYTNSMGPVPSQLIDENNLLVAESPSSGKMTTWSNLGKSKSCTQQHQSDRLSRARFREENTLNNNNNNSETSSPTTENRKSKSLPDMGRSRQTQSSNESQSSSPTDSKLVNNFMKVRDHRLAWDGEQVEEQSREYQGAIGGPIPMMRSKDTVNQFLKTTGASARLTSIEEATSESGTVSSETPTPCKPSRRSQPAAPAPNASSVNKPTKQNKYPDLNFLENDVGLWDAFFLHSKNANKFQSVLKHQQSQPPPQLPVEDYLRRQHQEQQRGCLIQDSDSLRILLPSSQQHLLPPPVTSSSLVGDHTSNHRSSPISQVCYSMSKLSHDPNTQPRYTNSHDVQNEAIKSLFNKEKDIKPIKMVKVKEAWTDVPEKETAVVRRRKKEENLINNNQEEQQSQGKFTKRRSFHPQDHLTQVFTNSASRGRKRSDFPKSGSQNDLCDTWSPEEVVQSDCSKKYPLQARPASECRPASCNYSHNGSSAEYPFFQMNCHPQTINFDLTRKRGLFVNLYSAVERLLMFGDSATPSSTPTSSSASIRCIIFRELCPALHAILEDGLKREVITSFGRMESSVWRMVEALTRQGPSSTNSVCDLVMLINSKFAASGEDDKKFAGFVAGLLNMSSLHIWFSKLKWSLDVLLRFYERHAFVCALHKETKLLFEELLFCLQRLYSIPFRVDLPFSMDLLDQLPDFYGQQQQLEQHQSSCQSCRTSCLGEETSLSEAGRTATSPGFSSSGKSSLRSRSSRIPRPISLPKRLEAKLGSPSAVRSDKMKPPLLPKSSTRKSRVRDTIKLFDSKKSSRPPIAVRPSSAARKLISNRASPLSGAGEALASAPEDDYSRGTSSGASSRR